MLMGPTRWSTAPAEIEFARYGDGTIAMLANDPKTGAPQLKLTVCLEGLEGVCPLGDWQVWLKTWSENEGVAEALVKAGVVTLAGRFYPVNAHGSHAVMATLTPAAVAEFCRQESA